MHASFIVALIVAVVVGFLAQKSRLCMVGGIRDIIMFKNPALFRIKYNTSVDGEKTIKERLKYILNVKAIAPSQAVATEIFSLVEIDVQTP